MSVKKGDMLWVKIKGASSDYGFGEVTESWEDDNGNILFNFHCLINGGLRMGLEKNIIDKPNERMKNKLFSNSAAIKNHLKKR